jgi:hypothetical protein
MRALIALLALLMALPAWGAACAARSGERTAALVELYTSEGCSSCPPADRWLSTLGAPERLVPLSLHVDYWDYLGWKDPYAQRRFSQRQRTLSQLQRSALVYTPQVLLQGRDFAAWRSPAFEAMVERINAQPARARIALDILSATPSGLAIALRAEVNDARRRGDAVLYVAAFQNRLQSEVKAGENSGRRLRHDYVVLEWLGPFTMGPEGRLDEQRRLTLLPNAAPTESGVAAFIQDRRTAEVLQALMLSTCLP